MGQAASLSKSSKSSSSIAYNLVFFSKPTE
jgi:hypothetical protein